MFAGKMDRNEWRAMCLVGLIFLVIAASLSMRPGSDDAYFAAVLKHDTLMEFMTCRYHAWSGRVLLDAINVATIRYALVWQLGIPLSFLLMCYQVYRLTLSRLTLPWLGILVVASLMLMLDGEVNRWGSWWVTGFYNYLLPATLGLFAFRCVLNKALHSNAYRLLAVPGAMIACQQEQVAICLVLALLVLAGCRLVLRCRFRLDLAVLAAGAGSAALLFLAPGNRVRLGTEINTWMPEFEHMGLIDKVILGVDRVNAHANNVHNHTFFLALLVTFVLVWVTRRRWWFKEVALWLLGASMAVILLGNAGLAVSDKLLFAGKLLPQNWTGYDVFLAYAKTLVLYGTLGACALYVSHRLRDGIIDVALLLLSFAMIMAIGFSPTVYGSGPRIFFIPDVLMVMYLCRVIATLAKVYRERAPRPQGVTPLDSGQRHE